MVTLSKYTSYGANRSVLELHALSTDTLPTDQIEGMSITNGSTTLIINNGAVKIFDEENRVWYEL